MLYSNFGYNLLGDIVRRVSGQPFWQFARSRLFEPLGMKDSHFVLPPALRERRVYRAPGMPGTAANPDASRLDSPEFDEMDLGSGGLASTTRDLAAFLRMLLNGGGYGDRRVLSRASVAAMTRHHADGSIAGQRATVTDGSSGTRRSFPAKRRLASLTAFGHSGYASSYSGQTPNVRFSASDPQRVAFRLHRGDYTSNVDLFQNAVHASILD